MSDFTKLIQNVSRLTVRSQIALQSETIDRCIDLGFGKGDIYRVLRDNGLIDCTYQQFAYVFRGYKPKQTAKTPASPEKRKMIGNTGFVRLGEKPPEDLI